MKCALSSQETNFQATSSFGNVVFPETEPFEATRSGKHDAQRSGFHSNSLDVPPKPLAEEEGA